MLRQARFFRTCIRLSQKLNITDAASSRLAQVCTEPGEYLRVSVGGGGCSGYSYEFELTTEPIDQENDLVFEKDNQKVVTDVDSIEFMDGSTIDYKKELIKKAFVVTDNPLADQNCSCGSSFSIDL